MHVLLVFHCGFVVYLPTTGGHFEDKLVFDVYTARLFIYFF
jgi:hypothetical protein